MAEVNTSTVTPEGISTRFSQVAAWVNGRLLGGDGTFLGASSDSRTLAKDAVHRTERPQSRRA